MQKLKYGYLGDGDGPSSPEWIVETCLAEFEREKYGLIDGNAAGDRPGQSGNLSAEDVAEVLRAVMSTDLFQWVQRKMAAELGGRRFEEIPAAEGEPEERQFKFGRGDHERPELYRARRERLHAEREGLSSHCREDYDRRQTVTAELWGDYTQANAEYEAVAARVAAFAEKHGLTYDAAAHALNAPPAPTPTR